MGATFSCNNNCFQSCSVKRFICCGRRSSRIKQKEKLKLTKIDHFTVSKLGKYDIEDIFDDQDIILTAIINNNNQIIFLNRLIEDEVYTSHNNNTKFNVDDLLSEKFQLLLKKINKKVMSSKNTLGCLVKYEDYDYSLIAFPIQNKDGVVLSSLVLKKVMIDFNEFDELDNISNNSLNI